MGRLDADPHIPAPAKPAPQHLEPIPPPLTAGPREVLPKLRDLRDDVFFWAEYNYLRNLVNLCGHNIKRACQVSGLSRSRLYSLLKKYQLTTPLHAPFSQK
jgi:DNA-binding NtrC family response regulator